MDTNQISPQALRYFLEHNSNVFLIDVREVFEHAHFNIGGINIPMNEILYRLDEIPLAKTLVFYCEKGIRSAIIIQRLQQKFNLEKVLNLQGGMHAWRAMFA
jgi:sulfur-carrier protein adenylyltransferase/sulfurtransferase